MMQPPSSPGQEDAVMAEEVAYDEGWQQTQQATQGIYNSHVDAHLWGFLQPCSAAIARMDFLKAIKVYDIGRNSEGNLFVLPGFKVSEYLAGFYALSHSLHVIYALQPLTLPEGNKHCKITWDGKEDTRSDVIIQDLSSNGTFVST